jgi:hypothetical protein
MVKLNGFKEFTRRVEGKVSENKGRERIVSDRRYWPLFEDTGIPFDRSAVLSLYIGLAGPLGLLSAFKWELTPEGHSYWDEIYCEGVSEDVKTKLREMLRQYEEWVTHG